MCITINGNINATIFFAATDACSSSTTQTPALHDSPRSHAPPDVHGHASAPTKHPDTCSSHTSPANAALHTHLPAQHCPCGALQPCAQPSTPRHTPLPSHTSLIVHASSSLHAPPAAAFSRTHLPSTHVSIVHGFLSVSHIILSPEPVHAHVNAPAHLP